MNPSFSLLSGATAAGYFLLTKATIKAHALENGTHFISKAGLMASSDEARIFSRHLSEWKNLPSIFFTDFFFFRFLDYFLLSLSLGSPLFL